MGKNTSFIEVDNITFSYESQSEAALEIRALSGISTVIDKGEFVVVLGRNGSGKSTFARHLNALLLPDEGRVLIKGMHTADESRLWDIRRTAGMVFQNPDNQIVGTIVEEDVAFGPENLGVPSGEIRERVDRALETVGMEEFSRHAPHLLSGGQKQRVALAGILAMKPECIILDEATAMLDPVGRKEVLRVLKRLNRDEGITIIHITHYMDEAATADRVVVINDGRIAMEGKPAEVFSNVQGVKQLGLDVPQVTELLYELKREGFTAPPDVITVEGAVEWITGQLKRGS